MLSAIVLALCLFPLIVKFSRKYNKRILLVAASIVFTVVFAFIYVGDKIAALAPGKELLVGILLGLVVSFPFAAINILPQACASDIIQKDSIEKMVVSSVLAIGAPEGHSVSLQGVKLTGVYAGLFSLLSLIFFIIYKDKKVTQYIEEHNKDKK